MSTASWPPTGNEVLAEGPIPWPQPVLLDGTEQFRLFAVSEAGRTSGTSRGPHEGALHLTVPAGRYLLSVEAWAPQEGLGGRTRHGITTEVIPDDLVTLSDLILLHPRDSLPQGLFSPLPSMRSSAQLKTNKPLVLGWETFGLSSR
jgi:hypothetical protein